jgi:hypothetical protein
MAMTVSCDGVALGAAGELYVLLVYTDGEGYNSYIVEEVDISKDEVETIEHLDVQLWLTDIWRAGQRTLFACDENGRIHVRGKRTWTVESTPSRKSLTCLFGFDEERMFTAGDAGVVFARQGTAWNALGPSFGRTLFGIGGTAPDDLYACGEAGLFAHFNGVAWRTIELPTNFRLLGILALAPDDVLVCGAGGVLFRGSGDDWRPLGPGPSDLFSITRFKGRIFLAGANSGVVELVGDDVVVVRDTFVSYKVTSNADFLASAGDISAVRSDLVTWDRMEYE